MTRILPRIAADTHGKTSTRIDRIVIDLTICHGKPIIHGARVAVVLDILTDGGTFELIQIDYLVTADVICSYVAIANHEVRLTSYCPGGPSEEIHFTSARAPAALGRGSRGHCRASERTTPVGEVSNLGLD